ncbi:hypothetical protein MGK_03635 [Candida albicans P57055]|nr:hypothetical protein MGK_03635 [Candida albicans P57055]
MLALENWHKVVLVTGNNRNLQDRCLSFQRWLSYFLLLRLTPCLKEMRCTMRRVSNLRGHTTFTSFSSDLLLPLNSTIHNIVTPIPQNILSYTIYTNNTIHKSISISSNPNKSQSFYNDKWVSISLMLGGHKTDQSSALLFTSR